MLFFLRMQSYIFHKIQRVADIKLAGNYLVTYITELRESHPESDTQQKSENAYKLSVNEFHSFIAKLRLISNIESMFLYVLVYLLWPLSAPECHLCIEIPQY